MLSNEWILNNKISGIKLVFSLYATIKMMHGPINIRFTAYNHLIETKHLWRHAVCVCVCVCVSFFYKGELGLSLSPSSGHWDACIRHSCCVVVSSKILPPLTQRQFPRTLEGFPVPRHNGEGDRIKQCSGFWEGKVTVSDTVQRWWAQSVWCGHVLLTHLFRLPMNNARATDCTCYKFHGAWVIAVASLTILM